MDYNITHGKVAVLNTTGLNSRHEATRGISHRNTLQYGIQGIFAAYCGGIAASFQPTAAKGVAGRRWAASGGTPMHSTHSEILLFPPGSEAEPPAASSQ